MFLCSHSDEGAMGLIVNKRDGIDGVTFSWSNIASNSWISPRSPISRVRDGCRSVYRRVRSELVGRGFFGACIRRHYARRAAKRGAVRIDDRFSRFRFDRNASTCLEDYRERAFLAACFASCASGAGAIWPDGGAGQLSRGLEDPGWGPNGGGLAHGGGAPPRPGSWFLVAPPWMASGRAALRSLRGSIR